MRPQLQNLAPEYDVIVLGGGATGLGIALDAQTRGFKTLLLEAHDYAKGTSSRSTKLVHGGVRYLAQGNVTLVKEALHERGLMRQNAPHLVHSLGFVIPSYSLWGVPFYGIGLKLYDALAGKNNFSGSRWLSATQTLGYLPNLKPEGLRGGVLYFDGQFDDTRYAISLLRTFLNHGGTAINYAPVQALLKSDNTVSGVEFTDQESQTVFSASAKVVINATGIFADSVRRMDSPSAKPLISPAQGVHIVLDKRFLAADHAVMIPKTNDGRVLFIIPWHDKVLLGTTDTAMPEPVIEPKATAAEIDFILHTAAQYLQHKPSRADILSVFAGMRPLVKNTNAASTAQLSREHTIEVSDSGLVSVVGGKWTTYRKMAADTLNTAMRHHLLATQPCHTEHLKLHGYSTTLQPEPYAVYGSDSAEVQNLGTRVLHPALPYTDGQVRFAARYEHARTVEDVLARRTRALFLDAGAALAMADEVAAIVQAETHANPRLEEFKRLAATYSG